jgi:hypothetical protein
LEINDAGLQAVMEKGYAYDCNMIEGQQNNYVEAAVTSGQDAKGFGWVMWPYTLDNGSPGTWQVHDFGEAAYMINMPAGLWEIPVYVLYIPDDNGLQKAISDRMKKEITEEDTSWIPDVTTSIESYDFNTFLYARVTKEEWLTIMKYNFLLRYNGNRAPMTYGGHPEEFSWRYDNVVLNQDNNKDFLDVLNYNKYTDRKAAMKEFLDWVTTNYGKDVWFMSHQQLVDYMKAPKDVDGNTLEFKELATPSTMKFFNNVNLTGHQDDLGSKIEFTLNGSSLEMNFTIGTNDETNNKWTSAGVTAQFNKGALKNVSHIAVVYESEDDLRIMLIPESGSALIGTQVLLGGIGGERTALIRIEDFRPMPYEDTAAILGQSIIDSDYLSTIDQIGFESGHTKGDHSFKATIKAIEFFGLDKNDLQKK